MLFFEHQLLGLIKLKQVNFPQLELTFRYVQQPGLTVDRFAFISHDRGPELVQGSSKGPGSFSYPRPSIVPVKLDLLPFQFELLRADFPNPLINRNAHSDLKTLISLFFL